MAAQLAGIAEEIRSHHDFDRSNNRDTEPAQPKYEFSDVKAVFMALSRTGYTDKLREIVLKYSGTGKLTAVSADDYDKVMAEAKALR